MEELEQPFRVEIIGVVEDFHFESLRANMMPVIFGALNTSIQVIDYYTIKIKTNDWAQTIETLKTINNKIDPNTPLEYTFLDSRFEELYVTDARRGQIFLTLSIIVVVIACLGLFALVSYSVESRMKEIGVRKVMGASVNSIVSLISKEFLILVVIAGVCWLAHSVVLYAELVAGVCVSGSIWSFGVCTSNLAHFIYCVCYHWLAGGSCCENEPSE
jgi:putative ABC transport system permease protein